MKIIISFLITIGLVYADFIRDDNLEIVIDTSRNIMWQDINITEKKIWKNANLHCETLVFATFDDWRLPFYKELQSIVDINRYYPAIYDEFHYTNMETNYSYNTLNTSGVGKQLAFTVEFTDGASYTTSKFLPNFYRCMRTIK